MSQLVRRSIMEQVQGLLQATTGRARKRLASRTSGALRAEYLETRVLLSKSIVHPVAMAQAQTAYLPVGITREELAAQLNLTSLLSGLSSATTQSSFTGLITTSESEPNNGIGTANLIPLGFDVGEDTAVNINGTLTTGPVNPITANAEDDGAIGLAGATGLVSGQSVTFSSSIGNGPFGATSGDFDVYSIAGVNIGDNITAFIDGTGGFDPMVAIYNSLGTMVAFNDDASGTDSFVSYSASAAGNYFVLIAGYDNLPTDPFNSASGDGAGSTGTYAAQIGLNATDADYFSVQLNAGDILGANVTGAGTVLSLYNSAGTILMESAQDATSIHPTSSPLPGGGNAALSWVAATTGTYYLRVGGVAGAYTVNTTVHRPTLESTPAGTMQTLFLDFDGGTVDATIFGGTGIRNLSGLSTFLAGWGLNAADESAVIDAIVASVTETFQSIGIAGNNGDFATTNTPGEFGIRILNSRDHADPFGQEHVSRIIVGGTIAELGISTIGIAETIDTGNFDTSETAVVLLDLLSAAASNANSLNQYSLAGGRTKIDLVGVGVGNITAHEAGHFFGSWHTNQFNATPNIMDQGGNLNNSVGLGGDTIFGNGNDVDVDFTTDQFVPNEGFLGTMDSLNHMAFGLSTSRQNGPAARLAVVGDNATHDALIINLDTNTLVARIDLPGTGLATGDVVVTADQSLAFVTTFERRVYVIDLNTLALGNGGNPIAVSTLAEDVDLTPDGRFLLVSDGQAGGPLCVVDVATLTEIGTYNFTTDVNSVDVGPGNQVLFTSITDGVVRRATIGITGVLTLTSDSLAANPNNVYLAPDGLTGVVVGGLFGSQGRISSFRTNGLTPRSTVSFNTDVIASGVFSPDGTRFYARDLDGNLYAFNYNPSTGAISPAPLYTRVTAPPSNFYAMEQMTISPDGTLLYLTEGNSVVVRDATTGLVLNTITLTGTLTGIALPANDQPQANVWGVRPATGEIVRIDPATGTVTDAFPAPGTLLPTDTNIGLSIAEGGRVLLYHNSRDGLVYRLNPVTGAVLSSYATSSTIDGLSFETSDDQRFVFLGQGDIHRQQAYGGSEIPDWATGTAVGGLGGDDNDRQFGFFADGFIHEFDPLADTNSFIRTLPSPASDVQGMAYDGTYLYVSTASGRLYTLNPDTGAILSTVNVPTGALYGLGARSYFAQGPDLTLTSPVLSLPEDTDTSSPVRVANLNVQLNQSPFVQFSLSGADAALFEVIGAQLMLRAGTILDFETNPVLDVVVRIDDPATPILPDDLETLSIQVTDVNESPTLTGATVTFAEHQPNSTVVATLGVSDPDRPNQTFTFRIAGGNTGGAFGVNSAGEVFVADSAAMNFETTPVFNLVIDVEDSGVPAKVASANVQINLTNLNETPVLNDATYSLNERSVVDTVVANLPVVDPDTNTTLTFQFLSGNIGNAFKIDSTGRLLVNDSTPLVFVTNPVFTLEIQVSDNGDPVLSDTAFITVNLLDINDPPIPNGASFTIVEHSPTNTLLGTLTGTDADGTIVAWSIVGGNAGNAFKIDNAGNLRVNTPSAVNYETSPVFLLTVEARDNGGTPGYATVRIDLTDRVEQDVLIFDDRDGADRWIFGDSNGAFFRSVQGPSWQVFGRLSFVRGDFDGDGDTDVAGRTESGAWLLGLVQETSMTVNLPENSWPAGVVWSHVAAGDVTGDGKDDIVGRAANGDWWLAQSDGTRFSARKLGQLPAHSNWTQHLLGDFNGDGRADLASFAAANGAWWVSSNLSTNMGSTQWIRVASQAEAGWQNFLVGDFNGDGRDDLVAQHSTGNWWKLHGQNTNRFVAQFGNRTVTNYTDFHVADFNGDGRDDVASRLPANSWWINHSLANGRFTIQSIGSWTTTQTWHSVVGDFNGDGMADIAGITAQSGLWYVLMSDGTKRRNTYFGQWNTNQTVFSTGLGS